MVQGIVIPADAESPLRRRDFARLEAYQAAVGGWIEAVDLLNFGVTIYVNEEGLLRHLPLNSRASFLWWYHVPEMRQKAMLVGDAVPIGLPDRNGNSTDLPDAVREILLSSAGTASRWVLRAPLSGTATGRPIPTTGKRSSGPWCFSSGWRRWKTPESSRWSRTSSLGE